MLVRRNIRLTEALVRNCYSNFNAVSGTVTLTLDVSDDGSDTVAIWAAWQLMCRWAHVWRVVSPTEVGGELG